MLAAGVLMLTASLAYGRTGAKEVTAAEREQVGTAASAPSDGELPPVVDLRGGLPPVKE